MVPIGIVDASKRVILNPKSLELSAIVKLVVIASDRNAIESAFEAISRTARNPIGECPLQDWAAVPPVLCEVTERKEVKVQEHNMYIRVEPGDERIALLSTHVVLVDLASARAPRALSAEGQREEAQFQANDLFDVIKAIKLQDPSTGIVLLSRYEPNACFAELFARTAWDPIVVLYGCGLNVGDLRGVQLVDGTRRCDLLQQRKRRCRRRCEVDGGDAVRQSDPQRLQSAHPRGYGD